MSGAVHTAEVEVLTAEVRVLMVGSRQVTLSVARQLDTVPLDQLVPFGRVRTGHEEWDEGTVIGKHHATGVLVRARYALEPSPVVPVVTGDLAGLLAVCPRAHRFAHHLGGPAYDRPITVRYRDRILRVDYAVTESLPDDGRHHHCVVTGCDACDAHGLDAALRACIAAHDRTVALHRQQRALPLIVLAGLR